MLVRLAGDLSRPPVLMRDFRTGARVGGPKSFLGSYAIEAADCLMLSLIELTILLVCRRDESLGEAGSALLLLLLLLCLLDALALLKIAMSFSLSDCFFFVYSSEWP